MTKLRFKQLIQHVLPMLYDQCHEDFAERRRHLHLEDVVAAPLAVRERERELVWLEQGLHHAVNVHLVPRHHRLAVRRRLLPLDRDVLEVAGSAETNLYFKYYKIFISEKRNIFQLHINFVAFWR